MRNDFIINGIHVGEHSFEPDSIIEEIKTRCIDQGYNYVALRPCNMKKNPKYKDTVIDQQYYLDWAKYLTDNRIYFSFVYIAQFPPNDKELYIHPETIAKIKEIAGDYFLGDEIGEPASLYASKGAGYFLNSEDRITYAESLRNFRIRFDYEDIKQANEEYVKTVAHFVDIDKQAGMPYTICVDATAFSKHNHKAGVDIPVLEVMPGDPDILISSVRGTARAANSKLWGTYFAHEWYGGFRHDDTLKKKRLEIAYKYSYLAGSQMFTLESGDECITAYGQKHDYDSEICQGYRDVLKKMQTVFATDKRPAGGPKVKVAFVSGLYDGWSGKWGRASLYNQFFREEWGYNDAEHSWLMLDEMGTKRPWYEVANYGEYDTSGAPAYGMYDIIPIEADIDVLSNYDYLIFLGWNSMTDENMEKLTEYVRRGGHLLMTAAHMNMQTKRNGEYIMPSGELVEDLFGCRYMGEIRRNCSGVQFIRNSLDERLLYPTNNPTEAPQYQCADPIYSSGYVSYLRFAVTDGKAVALSSDAFRMKGGDLPVVIENKVGKGVATLVTATEYPGNDSIRLLYRALVREIFSASARLCDIKVISSDRLRYAVYEGDKVYLLNTDYDLPIKVKLIKGEEQTEITLEPLELKALQV